MRFHSNGEVKDFLIGDVLGLDSADRASTGNMWTTGEIIKLFKPTYYTYPLNYYEMQTGSHYPPQGDAKQYSNSMQRSLQHTYWKTTEVDPSTGILHYGESGAFSSYGAIGVNWQVYQYYEDISAFDIVDRDSTALDEPRTSLMTTHSQVSSTLSDTTEDDHPYTSQFGGVVFHTLVKEPTDSNFQIFLNNLPDETYASKKSSFFNTYSYRPKHIMPLYTYTDTQEHDRVMNESLMADFGPTGIANGANVPTQRQAFGTDKMGSRSGSTELPSSGAGQKFSIGFSGAEAGLPMVDYVAWYNEGIGATDDETYEQSLEIPWGTLNENDYGNRSHPTLPIRAPIKTTDRTLWDDLGYPVEDNVATVGRHHPFSVTTQRILAVEDARTGPDLTDGGPYGWNDRLGVYAIPIYWKRVLESKSGMLTLMAADPNSDEQDYAEMVKGTDTSFNLSDATVQNFYVAKGGGAFKFFGALEGIFLSLIHI